MNVISWYCCSPGSKGEAGDFYETTAKEAAIEKRKQILDDIPYRNWYCIKGVKYRLSKNLYIGEIK